MFKYVILILLSVFSIQSHAELDIKSFGQWDKAEPKIILGLGSYHLDPSSHERLNESNTSLGLELWDLQAVYIPENSWKEPSVYATWAPDYVYNDYLTISGQIGFSTGYKCTNGVQFYNERGEDMIHKISYCSDSGVVPLAAVTFAVHPFGDGLALNLSVAPAVLMLSTSYDF